MKPIVMRLTKVSLLILLTFVLIAMYVAKLADLLTVAPEDIAANVSVKPVELPKAQTINEFSSVYPNGEFSNLVWFLQISDLHLSQFIEKTRIKEFKEFCEINVHVIRPQIVLATGDLTDGKTSDMTGSREFEEEWKIYYRVLDDTKMFTFTKWLDVRGNHDNFNVPSIESKENYFRQYSAQGKEHAKSYMYQLQQGSNTYSFIALDACLQPGPRRPFNFVGLLKGEDMYVLTKLEQDSRNSTATFWFGHYPTSCILSPNPGIRHLMRNGIAYLCGHFHTLGGLVPAMYTQQKTGNLELELGDWKDSRRYRILAVDNGLFSFIDKNLKQWPVILITNPKDALFTIRNNEPVHRMMLSTHIRILVFSPDPIVRVAVQINDKEWKNCTNVEGPLYVLKWDPNQFKTGIHQLHVYAKDSSGREEGVKRLFSLDGTQLNFGLLPRILLMSNIPMVMQGVFGFSVLMAIIPLCLVRMIHHFQKRKVRPFQCSCKFLKAILRKLWLISTIDRFYYPLIILVIYVPLGPWIVGEILEDHVGVIFSWGIYVNGTFIPGGLTYAYGFLHIWVFNILVMATLSHCVDVRYQRLTTGKRPTTFKFIMANAPIMMVLVLNAYLAYFVWLAYGPLAFFVGPLKTWTIIAGVYLWYLASSLPMRSVLHLQTIFPMSDKKDQEEEIVPLHMSTSMDKD